MTSVAVPHGRVNAAAIEWIGYEEGLQDDFHIVVRTSSANYHHSTVHTLVDARANVAILCIEANWDPPPEPEPESTMIRAATLLPSEDGDSRVVGTCCNCHTRLIRVPIEGLGWMHALSYQARDGCTAPVPEDVEDAWAQLVEQFGDMGNLPEQPDSEGTL